MLGGVPAPGTPTVRPSQKLRRSRTEAAAGGAPHQPAVARGERVGLPRGAESDVVRGPLADAADRAQLGDGLVQGARGLEERGVAHRRLDQRGERTPPLRRHPERREVGSSDLLRRREDPGRRAHPWRRGRALAAEVDETRHEPPTRNERDLLPEDRPHRGLELAPGAWRPQPGPRCDQRCEARIAREVPTDVDCVGAEVEHAPHAGDDRCNPVDAA